MNTQKPILGSTLYSFTHEWKSRLYTLEQIIEKIAEKNIGPAVEIVGFQSFRGFPDVSDEYAENFKAVMEKYNLIPSCLGGNSDVGRRPGKDMTEEEIISYIERQVISAKKLGFPVLRIQAFIGPDMFEKLAPIAEKAEVQIGPELHAPLAAGHPVVDALMERYEKVGSPFLGFVPDFSSVMTQPPEIHWTNLRNSGVPESLIEIAQNTWHSNKPADDKFATLRKAVSSFNVSGAVMGALNRTLTMFGNMNVEGLRALIPYTKHIHGKFYHVNEDSLEPSIPYPEIFQILKEENFSGTISAEWEGHAFTKEMVGFEEVQAWHAMCGRLLAD